MVNAVVLLLSSVMGITQIFVIMCGGRMVVRKMLPFFGKPYEKADFLGLWGAYHLVVLVMLVRLVEDEMTEKLGQINLPVYNWQEQATYMMLYVAGPLLVSLAAAAAHLHLRRD